MPANTTALGVAARTALKDACGSTTAKFLQRTVELSDRSLFDLITQPKNMNDTPTPETNEMLQKTWQSINFPTNPVPADFARQLERERDAVIKESHKIADLLDAEMKLSSRLAKAVDRYLNYHSTDHSELIDAYKSWLEARKP